MIQSQLKIKFMKEWEIWMEGYCATGQSAPATFEGKWEGESFDKAVEKFVFVKNLWHLYDKGTRLLPRDSDGIMKEVTVHRIWACRLFDNEADARASFG